MRFTVVARGYVNRMPAKKLIIDTDIGTYYDDAPAVLLACRSPELALLGVTTVYGDTNTPDRAQGEGFLPTSPWRRSRSHAWPRR